MSQWSIRARVTTARGVDGNPHVEAPAIERGEMRLHDSNYGRDHTLDSEGSPQNLRITVELVLPELGADVDSLGTILRFRGKKNSPQNWFRPQQAEQIRSDIFHTQGSRLAQTGNAGERFACSRYLHSERSNW